MKLRNNYVFAQSAIILYYMCSCISFCCLNQLSKSKRQVLTNFITLSFYVILYII